MNFRRLAFMGLVAAGCVAWVYWGANFDASNNSPNRNGKLDVQLEDMLVLPAERPVIGPLLKRDLTDLDEAEQLVPDLKKQEFAANFLHSKNYRQFIHSALAYPESGGSFYAREAFFLCKQWRALAHSWSESAIKQNATLSQLRAAESVLERIGACEGVEEQMGSDLQFLSRIMKLANRDPLVIVEKKILEKKGVVSAELWSLVIREKAPILVRAVVAGRLESLVSSNGRIRVLVDGEAKFEYASSYLACELVNDCLGGFAAVSDCLQNFGCQSLDLREQILSRMTTAEREKFQQLLSEIRAAGVGFVQ
ncbi:hypothetical protein [Kinneretia aquatilis]|uniref:hypothetical protein n=1 Tax=Kinneretia aquatilis TaxID=2070761 RepID=UPI0014952FB4|nr:hypothetical protein [Paucibacter aquatile]WIV97608.1 hypothetical protein K9V56_021760 [Paucibacter aquatile]